MARNVGIELARLDVCRACPGYQSTPLRENACCRKCGVDKDDLPWQLINDPPDQPFLNGLESNCPLGLWRGVEPKDSSAFEAEQAAQLERIALKFLRRNEPLIRRLPKGEADLRAALDEMVAVQTPEGEDRVAIPAELRDAIMAELEKADAKLP